MKRREENKYILDNKKNCAVWTCKGQLSSEVSSHEKYPSSPIIEHIKSTHAAKVSQHKRLHEHAMHLIKCLINKKIKTTS